MNPEKALELPSVVLQRCFLGVEYGAMGKDCGCGIIQLMYRVTTAHKSTHCFKP